MIDLAAVFEKHENEFLRFERVANKRSKRPDLHAFLLLDEIVPPEPTAGYPDRTDESYDMVAGAEHDEIYLQTEPDKLAEKATEEQIVELMRCGVRLSDGNLCMFV